MGLFDNILKKKAGTGSCVIYDNKVRGSEVHGSEVLETAGIISYQDKRVMKELKEYLSDAENYFITHSDMFEEGGCIHFSNEWEICRYALTGLLEQGNYICIRDWKDEKEDFIYYVQSLQGFKRSGLQLEAGWLDDDGCIGSWSGILDTRWHVKDCYLAAIDIESDSYALFVCNGESFQRLQILSELTGYKIDLAKNI